MSNLPEDKIPATFLPPSQHKFTINLNSITNRADYQECTAQSPIEIFTDGSHINNRTGFGYCIYSNKEESGPELLAEGNGFLGQHATVFQAETHAIEAAIQHLEHLTTNNIIPNNSHVTIHSDSQSTLKALANEPTHSKTTLSCQNTLQNACSQRKITLRWVKAHCGIQGNERADQEAKKGAIHRISGPEPWLPLPTTFFKKAIKKLIDFHWTARWQNNKACRQTKLFFQKPNSKITKQIIQRSKHTYGKAVRWLTGHCFLNRHNNLLDPFNNPDPLCRHCQEEDETPWHIIARCGAFQHLRLQHFNLHELPDNFEWEGQDLINFLKHPSVNLMEDDNNTNNNNTQPQPHSLPNQTASPQHR